MLVNNIENHMAESPIFIVSKDKPQLGHLFIIFMGPINIFLSKQLGQSPNKQSNRRDLFFVLLVDCTA